jgi:hypothetical protein
MINKMEKGQELHYSMVLFIGLSKWLRVHLVGWMRWDEVGWDGVFPFFIVFGWESTLSVRDERQEKWDKSISEKITNELILLC